MQICHKQSKYYFYKTLFNVVSKLSAWEEPLPLGCEPALPKYQPTPFPMYTRTLDRFRWSVGCQQGIRQQASWEDKVMDTPPPPLHTHTTLHTHPPHWGCSVLVLDAVFTIQIFFYQDIHIFCL